MSESVGCSGSGGAALGVARAGMLAEASPRGEPGARVFEEHPDLADAPGTDAVEAGSTGGGRAPQGSGRARRVRSRRGGDPRAAHGPPHPRPPGQ